MKVICAWCQKHLYGEGDEISHGICRPCAIKQFNNELRAGGGTEFTLRAILKYQLEENLNKELYVKHYNSWMLAL